MDQQEVHNLRMAEVNGLIEELERDIARLRHRMDTQQHASDAERQRDARHLEFYLNAIAIVHDMARDLEEERANRILVSIQEEMTRMNFGNGGQGGNANGNN